MAEKRSCDWHVEGVVLKKELQGGRLLRPLDLNLVLWSRLAFEIYITLCLTHLAASWQPFLLVPAQTTAEISKTQLNDRGRLRPIRYRQRYLLTCTGSLNRCA